MKKRAVPTINDLVLEDLLSRAPAFAVAYVSHSSIPCDQFIAELNAMPEIMHHSLLFYHLDVDENPEATEIMKVFAVPTVVLYKNGLQIAKYEGPYSKEALKDRIQAALEGKKK